MDKRIGWPNKCRDFPEWMTEGPDTFHTAVARLHWEVGNLWKAIGDSIPGRLLSRVRVACWQKGGAIHDYLSSDPRMR